jgi:heme exporter protein D
MLDFHAGKYAAFVWPAYGLTVLIIGALVADTLARARRWRLAVEAREAELALEPPPEPKP